MYRNILKLGFLPKCACMGKKNPRAPIGGWTWCTGGARHASAILTVFIMEMKLF